MPNKKINELTPRTPTLTDLIIVGDPSSGFSFKATLSAMVNFVGGNIQFSSLGGISLTNPTNGQVLTFNGTNWVNQTPASAVSSVFGRTGAVVATEGDYSLTQLSDVTLSSPTTNQVLQYNGTAWVNGTISVPVTSVFGRTGVVVATEGDYNLGQLGDVTISSPTSGQVLKYNGTAWVNDSDTDTGITSLNGLTATTQTFATGTSGTDFTISSTTSTHTFNIPTASSSNRGLLSSADWSTFNAKQSAITLTTTGSSGASTLVGATLNIPTYTLAGLGGVSGSGTTNYVSKWTGSTALGNSQIFDNGTQVLVGTTTTDAVNGLVVRSLTNGDRQGLRVYANNQSAYTQIGWNGIEGTLGEYQVRSAAGLRLVTQTASGHFYIQNSGNYFSYLANGNAIVGGFTDAGFRLDVQGTFRSTLDANINGLTVGKGGGSVSDNTAFGVEAINATATGTSNTAIGWRSGRAITTGNFNTLLGSGTLQNGTTAGGNTAIGYNALNTATSGSENIAVGQNSLRLLTTGYWNVAVGRQAGNDVTTGYQNVFIGDNTGRGITTGNSNTIIGAGITGLSSSLSNTIILADGQGNQRLRISSTGNASIGLTADNGYKLEVNGTIKSTGFIYAAGGNIGVDSDYGLYSTGNILEFGNGGINGTEAMRITGSRNLLIGTTTDAGYKLDVNGTARVSGTAVFQTANNTSSIQDLVTATTYSALYLKASTPSVTNYALATDASSTLLNSSGVNGIEFRVQNSMKWAIKNGTLTNNLSYTESRVPLWIATSAAANWGMIISASASQSNNLFELRSSSTTTIGGFDGNGNLFIGSTSLNASAALEVTSTTKGFLPPRMTTTQKNAISSPAAGLVVYDTTLNKLCVYTTAWETVTSL